MAPTAAPSARHRALLARLERLDVALAAYDAWAAEQDRPPDQRRPLPRPVLTRDSLVDLRRALVLELTWHEAA
jgi:hypothetical protein